MKPNSFFCTVSIIVLISAIVPGIAFCELKPLDDTELSSVEAQSGISNNEKGLRTYDNSNRSSACVTGEDGFCGVNEASTCSNDIGCSNNDPFDYTYSNQNQSYNQNQIYNMNQAPTCSSGGCGK